MVNSAVARWFRFCTISHCWGLCLSLYSSIGHPVEIDVSVARPRYRHIVITAISQVPGTHNSKFCDLSPTPPKHTRAHRYCVPAPAQEEGEVLASFRRSLYCSSSCDHFVKELPNNSAFSSLVDPRRLESNCTYPRRYYYE